MSHTFSAGLLELRRRKSLSQRQAAAELGISQALLSHYENGLREPKLDFLVKVCDYYDVSADYLLGRERPAQYTDEARELIARMRRLCDEAEAILNDNTERDHI